VRSAQLFPIPGPWLGHLAVIPRPRGGDWLEEEAGAWRRSGIDVVVSLLESEEAAQLDLLTERQAAETNGIQFISFPIPDRGLPASTPAALSLLSDITGALEQGKSVAVHCRQSIGRAGLIAAGVLIASGITPDRALEAVTSARGLTVPETSEQREWICQLPSRASIANTR
jgi:protein-tyrosine phosphatase